MKGKRMDLWIYSCNPPDLASMICRYQSGDWELFQSIFDHKKNDPVRRLIKKWTYNPHHGIDLQDIEQESRIAMHKAILTYSPQAKKCSIATWAVSRIRWELCKFNDKSCLLKHSILNNSQSFSHLSDDESDMEFEDVIKSDTLSPEGKAIENELSDRFIATLREKDLDKLFIYRNLTKRISINRLLEKVRKRSGCRKMKMTELKNIIEQIKEDMMEFFKNG